MQKASETKHMRSATTKGLLISLSLAISSGAVLADEVNPARATWDTFWFGGAIARIGLQELGYDVADAKTLNNQARFTALASGDIDFETDTVMPNAAAQLAPFGDDIVLLGPVMNPGSVQGYLIDRTTSEAKGITHVEQLRDSAVAAIFDSDGDGLANLVGCNPGWSCEGTVIHQMEAYNLSPTVEHVQGEYNVLVGDVVARHKAGEPVLLYAWFPNTATLALRPGEELVWLQVEETKLPNMDVDASIPDLPGCAGNSNPCNTGWLKTEYYFAANSNWAAANPVAAKFLSSMRIDLEARVAQNSAMNAGEDSERDMLRHAKDWIAANHDEFAAWIAAAKAVGQ